MAALVRVYLVIGYSVAKEQNQTEITVAVSHFIQEDSGPEIGGEIAGWSKYQGCCGWRVSGPR